MQRANLCSQLCLQSRPALAHFGTSQIEKKVRQPLGQKNRLPDAPLIPRELVEHAEGLRATKLVARNPKPGAAVRLLRLANVRRAHEITLVPPLHYVKLGRVDRSKKVLPPEKALPPRALVRVREVPADRVADLELDHEAV